MKALPSPEIALPDVLTQLRQQGVPVKLLQLDGWWMDGHTTAPNSALFPHGWDAFRASLASASGGGGGGGGNATADIALLLYKAFFSPAYDLFDRYRAVEGGQGAHYPCADDAEPFFAEYFRQAKLLGMAAYETDFMSDHWIPTVALANNTGGLNKYLSGLSVAAAAAGVPMQWCMPTAGIVLAAADKPAVTNARASVDFACEGPLALNTTWAP